MSGCVYMIIFFNTASGLGGSDSKYGMKARKKRTLDVSSVDDFPELGK